MHRCVSHVWLVWEAKLYARLGTHLETVDYEDSRSILRKILLSLITDRTAGAAEFDDLLLYGSVSQ
jgi:hypothetical protein